MSTVGGIGVEIGQSTARAELQPLTRIHRKWHQFNEG